MLTGSVGGVDWCWLVVRCRLSSREQQAEDGDWPDCQMVSTLPPANWEVGASTLRLQHTGHLTGQLATSCHLPCKYIRKCGRGHNWLDWLLPALSSLSHNKRATKSWTNFWPFKISSYFTYFMNYEVFWEFVQKVLTNKIPSLAKKFSQCSLMLRMTGVDLKAEWSDHRPQPPGLGLGLCKYCSRACQKAGSLLYFVIMLGLTTYLLISVEELYCNV